jgi:hypothetical protein
LRDFRAWVEGEYLLIKVYNRRQDLDRGIYVRRHDADLPSIRERLTIGTMAVGADFGGLRLVSAGIDRPEFRHGEGAGLTFQWEATRELPADYHVLTVLRSGDGQAWDQQQESLAGGSVGTSEWEVGHWLFQNTFVRADTRVPLGAYSVGISVYDSRTRQLVPLADGRWELPVAQVEVREREP